jgi:hypothetical protein
MKKMEEVMVVTAAAPAAMSKHQRPYPSLNAKDCSDLSSY